MSADTFRESLRHFERINLKINKSRCFDQITIQQCHAIHAIGSFDTPIQSSVLAEELTIDRSTVSRTVEGLVKKGWVNREIPPSNRRQTLLSLTETGKALLHRIDTSCNDIYSSALDALGAEGRLQFEQLFRSFTKHLKQYEESK